MNRAPLAPVPCARRTEPSVWLCPPPGHARWPDGYDLHHTDVGARLRPPLGNAEPATVLNLFPPNIRSTTCA